MHCQICQKAGLADDATHCPQCNSDLTGLHRLRNISVAMPDVQAIPLIKSMKTAPILLAAAALIFTAVAILFWRKPNEANMYAINTATDSLKTVIAAIKTDTKTETAATEKTASTPYIYVAKKGDNLARMAHYFYGDARAYSKILKDNNLPKNYLLLVGDTLTLNLNR